MVEAIFDGAQLGIGDGAEVEAVRQVLSSQAVGVLVAAALPGRVGIGEEEIGLQCRRPPALSSGVVESPGFRVESAPAGQRGASASTPALCPKKCPKW